jgi:AraC-like DNA-binding protein
VTGAVLRRLVRARELLHADVQRGPTLEELAREAGLSRAHLARQFAAAFGAPPHRYLTQLRMRQAKLLLAAGQSVTDVCLGVGFESIGTFSTTFSRHTGFSPRAWQRETRTVVQSRGLPVIFIPPCFLKFYAEHV